jgi:methyl-accepting chemotaxis protein WspA
MKKLTLWTLAACALGSSYSVTAATVNDVGSALMEARTHLVAMLDATEKEAQDALVTQINAASSEVDAAVTAILEDSATSADNAAALNQFKEIWEAFKTTRGNEIIPALYEGKVEDAKAVAKGIQAERIKQMKEILTNLGWTEPTQ